MPIWRARPITAVGEVVLERWRIMQTESGGRHLVGARPERGTHRVSSAIVEIDLVNRIVITGSGRRYTLSGDPGGGTDEERDYVWMAWCEVNKVIAFRDVTDELLLCCGASEPKNPPHSTHH